VIIDCTVSRLLIIIFFFCYEKNLNRVGYHMKIVTVFLESL
jgi:hypothetical protein